MSTLLRVLIALVAAVTVCIAGWAGLHAFDPPTARVTAPPPDLTLPPAEQPVAVLPLSTRKQQPGDRAVEASGPPARATGASAVEIALHGEAPALPLVVTLRSGWSKAPLAVHPLGAAELDAGRLVLPHVPRGEHELFLAVAGSSTWLSRTTVRVPAGEPVPIDLRTGSLRIRVRSGTAPVASALVVVSRQNDPTWVPPLEGTAGIGPALTDVRGEVRIGPLGPGSYRVSLADDDGSPPMDVEVPSVSEVELTRAPRR